MKTISKKQMGVKVAAAIKAGGIPGTNHNRRLEKTGVKVAAAIKAGGIPGTNHNRKFAFAVKSGVKAGESIITSNHSRRAA